MKRSAKPECKGKLSRLASFHWRRFWGGVCQSSPALCRFLEKGHSAAFRFDPEILEVQSAVLCLSAALRLGFRALWVEDKLSNSAVLTSLLPFWVWSALFVLMGLSHVLGLVTGRLSWRATSAMIGVLVWSFVAFMMMLDGLTGPGTALFPVIAISEAWLYLRLTTCCPSRGGLNHLFVPHLDAASESIRMNGEKAQSRSREIAEAVDV